METWQLLDRSLGKSICWFGCLCCWSVVRPAPWTLPPLTNGWRHFLFDIARYIVGCKVVMNHLMSSMCLLYTGWQSSSYHLLSVTCITTYFDVASMVVLGRLLMVCLFPWGCTVQWASLCGASPMSILPLTIGLCFLFLILPVQLWLLLLPFWNQRDGHRRHQLL